MHIMSTNFVKTLIWKHEYDAKLWRHKEFTPQRNDHHMPLNEPPTRKFSSYATVAFLCKLHGYCCQQSAFLWLLPWSGACLCGIEMGKRFVNFHLHCIISNLKTIRNIQYLGCPSLEKFLWTPMFPTQPKPLPP